MPFVVWDEMLWYIIYRQINLNLSNVLRFASATILNVKKIGAEYMNLDEAKKFFGIELKERSVKALFRKCSPTEQSQHLETALLFTKVFGYHKDEEPIIFDTDKLIENKEYILYLFGQLREFHNNEEEILRLEDTALRYDGNLWTTDVEYIMKLLYLGVSPSVGAITPLKYPEHYAFKNPDILPTLFPLDPNFDSWIREYQKELIRKINAQE